MNRACLLICLLLMSFNVTAQDLGDILELNAAAHGGAGNFARTQNVRFLLTISESGFEVSGTYVATRQGSMRTVRERDYRAFHPAIDATRETVETRFEGELWMDGVLRFARSENIYAETGDWLGTTSVRSVEHNIDVVEGYFQPQ